jgi:regulator of protease activity HflC (stomatin/prohibitin superfamily)
MATVREWIDRVRRASPGAAAVLVIAVIVLGWLIYTQFRIDVPSKHIAILIRKTGEDIANAQEVAPSPDHKGIQAKVLSEGRYFYNPYTWDWEVIPMTEIPAGKLGVVVRLHGDDLGYGEFVAKTPEQKGIVEKVLRPGRYPINPYLEKVELHEPVTIPAGFKGVVTNLSGPMPEDPNRLLVPEGTRGVQGDTLDPGTYYVNPYTMRINAVDCRSQRFNLGEGGDMGFPSKDGFWVSLDGIIEFRIQPDQAARVFVTYNDSSNDAAGRERVDEEIINKIILPNARSFCRLRGSNSTGRDFIGGETRIAFQEAFQAAMREACEPLGVEIIQALITNIEPPQAIAGPVRDREVSKQKLKQYTQQILQQESEVKLAIQRTLVVQKQALIAADQDVVKMTVEAQREQAVAVTAANEKREVAALKLEAARDEAEAILSRGKAEAAVVLLQNEAEAAGWRRTVEAFGGDGSAFARYVLLQKLAPGFRTIMSNTADSPLMEVFRLLTRQPRPTFVPEALAEEPPVRELPPIEKEEEPIEDPTIRDAEAGGGK